jgi:ABC-2 type transport system ATP-binding protein
VEDVLHAEHLSKVFGKLIAVDDVSLSIGKGECVAFLGPNGAGKTTTVEILEGLQQPDSGSVKIFGMPLASAKEKILQKTGVLLQETYLYKKLTVKETLNLFASFYKDSESVDSLIKAVELEDKADSRLEALSGGQKQRVYLACGLINKPDLFFLDEPTTGLDPQARRMIWSLLEGLKKKGCSMLLTTHYMEEAEVLADRVLIIDQGRIIAEGSPDQLVKTHCGDEQILIELKDEEAESVKNRVRELVPKEAKLTETENNSLVIHSSDAIKIVGVLSPMLEVFASLQLKRSNLEDVFLKLTGRSIRDA